MSMLFKFKLVENNKNYTDNIYIYVGYLKSKLDRNKYGIKNYIK
jgi:hypothetical protein